MLEQLSFFGMLIATFIVAKTSLRYPFQWMETFFHEFSHGLAALFTFGWICRIELSFNGAGVCWTRGGFRVPILLAGYLGAVTWGAFIYLAGWSLNTTGDVTLLYTLIGVLGFSIIFWVRNLTTLFIMLIMMLVFWIPTQFQGTDLPAYAIEFYGLYVAHSAVTAPLNLIDGKHEGDGADLADIFLILPEGVWIALWFVYALAVLIWLWQVTTPAEFRILQDVAYMPFI